MAEDQAELTQESGSAPSIQRAHDALATGRKLLAERQKLIRIADRSEFGWGVVAEYTADELTDDSDDEKRLEKAEKAAERKAAKRKRKRAEPTRAGKGRFNPVQSASTPSVPAPTPTSATFSARRPAVVPAPARAIGPCFACGEMGHLRTYCPKTAPDRKWYLLQSGVSRPSELLPGGNKEPGMPVVPGSVDVALADRGGGDLGSVGRCWEIEAAEQIEAGELVSEPGLCEGQA